MPRDCYEVLGVPRDADEKQIRKAFRGLARELHPDVNPDPEAEERFKEVAEAYEILSDQERRSVYDRYGHDGLEGRGWSPGFEGFSSFADLFSSFFGGGDPRQGQDLGLAIEVPLEEAFSGVSRTLRYEAVSACDDCSGSGAEPGTCMADCSDCGGHGVVRSIQRSPFGQIVREGVCGACGGVGRRPEVPCGSCGGSGRVRAEQQVDVEIPAGIADGQRIRIPGRGNAGSAGQAPGDLQIVVQIPQHESFVRDGDDLVCVIDLSVARAALGTRLTIDGLDGDVDLDIPAGVQPGEVIEVRGRGMPSLHGRRRGDIRVVAAVHVPRRLSHEQRETFEQLAETLPDEPPGSGGILGRIRSALAGNIGG